ncbi:MAG TPA: metallopeptidase TldD-related protein [Micavibrio sp.]
MSEARRIADQFFFAQNHMDPDAVTKIVTRTLAKADGGELYLQRSMGKSTAFSDGRLVSSAPPSLSQGFGFRFVSGAAASYAHSPEISEANIKKLASVTKAIRQYSPETGRVMIPSPGIVVPSYYTADNPLDDIADEARIKLLEEINAYARAADSRVMQVSASVSSSWNVVTIIRHDGQRFDDVRPMSQVQVSLIVQDGARKEQGSHSVGCRATLSQIFAQHNWKDCVDKALYQATTNLRAMPAPSGDLPVVLGNGWAAVMLHEAVGHGLEGDAARKGASVYAKMLGQKVASDLVTILDQGNIPGERGTLNFDDEGYPTQKTLLIENGILKGFMQDSVSARLMGVAPTGNGRRESYNCQPMTRMTTTFMAPGESDPAEIIASVKDGIYAVQFAGGQVDTVSGDYVFAPTLAFRIRDGKVAEPLKNAILSGNGPDSMRQVEMVGRDLALGTTGMCGKSGQSVPVGVGQPTVKMRGIRVGGSQPS